MWVYVLLISGAFGYLLGQSLSDSDWRAWALLGLYCAATFIARMQGKCDG